VIENLRPRPNSPPPGRTFFSNQFWPTLDVHQAVREFGLRARICPSVHEQTHKGHFSGSCPSCIWRNESPSRRPPLHNLNRSAMGIGLETTFLTCSRRVQAPCSVPSSLHPDRGPFSFHPPTQSAWQATYCGLDAALSSVFSSQSYDPLQGRILLFNREIRLLTQPVSQNILFPLPATSSPAFSPNSELLRDGDIFWEP